MRLTLAEAGHLIEYPQVVGFGLAAFRVKIDLYRKAVDLVSRAVCTIEDVDKACVFGPGLRWAFMGPNLVFHLGSGPSGIENGLRRYMPAFALVKVS